MTTQPISFEMIRERKGRIAVIGLGYVGLPLAVAFARHFDVVGIDINSKRIEELKKGLDRTEELSASQLNLRTIQFTDNPAEIAGCAVLIVTVPTPVDAHKNPDLGPLVNASQMIGRHLKVGTTIVFESTVHPGCTEEDCRPVIEQASGLRWKKDFFLGYSPERINPGDREHTIEKICKVVSGDLPATANLLRRLYGTITTAGIHVAPTIQTAEAAKVIENTQRDLNIALMNELALIFGRLGINTADVLAAAGTKWNFLPFRPGLVGGHCIGVDPYYLTRKAESVGYHPQVILAGRRINDAMGKYIAEQTVKRLIAADQAVKGSRVLILGWTFKENVPDIRNTRVIDIYRELLTYGVEPLPFDPRADRDQVKHEYGIQLIDDVTAGAPYDAVVLAVRHKELVESYPLAVLKRLGRGGAPVIIDVKGFFTANEYMREGVNYWLL